MNSILKRLRRVAPASMALAALALSIMPLATSEAAVANTLSFQGRLLTGPTTPAANINFEMRFSLWAGADFQDGVDRNAGSLVGAPWQEVQTVTTDAQGFFIANVGSVASLPTVFDSNLHQYLQAEVKPLGQPDTKYFLLDTMPANDSVDRKSISSSVYAQNAARLDGRKLGFEAGDIPFLDPVTGKLDRTLMTDDSWLDPVADVAALNALTDVENGDIVFVKSTSRIYTYDGATWLKTGGDLDNSVAAAEGRLDTAEADINANTAAISAEAARAAAAESTLTTNLSAESARAAAAEAVLASDLSDEVARALAAETILNTAITSESARAAAAEAVLTSDLSDENLRALAAEAALNSAITSEATRALAAEAVLTSDLNDEVTRALAAETALNSAITSEATRALAAEAALETRMTSTELNTAANLAAIQSNDGELSTLNGDVNTAGSVLKSIKDNGANAGFASGTGLAATTLGSAIDEVNTNLSNAIQGLSWKSPVTNVADLTTTYPNPVEGDTAYITSIGEIYTYNGTEWVKTGADFFQDGDTSNKGIVQFATDGEIAALKAVQSNDSRLAQVAVNTTNIATNAANIATNNSNISVNAAGIITEKNRAEAAEAALTTALNTERSRALAAELENSDAITAEQVRAMAAEAVNAAGIVTEQERAEAVEAALQSALNAETTRATAAEAANAAAIAAEQARAEAAEAANTAADNAHRDFNSTGFDVFIVDFN